MGFGTFTDMPYLRDYDYALAHYKSIVPLRGRGVDVRPLCKTGYGRRKTHMLIHETTYDGLPAIGCCLYKTDVVTYVSDGRVVIDNYYQSSSTNTFATGLLDGRVYMGGKLTWYTSMGKSWWIPARGKLELIRVDGVLTPTKPHQPYKYDVIRKKANEYYRKYAAFTTHCVSIAKLLGDSVSKEYLGGYIPLVTLPDSENLQEWGPAVKYFLQRATSTVWIHYVGGYSRGNKLCPKKVKLLIREQVKREHAQDIFTRTPTQLGVFINDPNRKYWS